MYIFKRPNLGLISAILLLAMVVVACRGVRPVLPPATTPTEAATLSPRPPSETPCLPERPIEEDAREALANWLGVSGEEIEVVEVEEVEWPDTSLGCPQPGMVYAQVITPGCRVTLEAAGETYEVHTGGQQMVVCDEDGNPLLSR